MPRTRKVEFYKRMHCHNDDFVRCCMRGDYCGCCQNEQDGRFPCWEGKLWVFANFLERWLHYKVNNHTITKNKPIYHARNVNGWRSSVEPGPFISLLILHMINRLIFHHGIVIYIRIRVVLILVKCRNVYHSPFILQNQNAYMIILDRGCSSIYRKKEKDLNPLH